MKWNERYSGTEKPDIEQISAFVASPLWDELCSHLQSCYNVSPGVEYSICSTAPGWNVKYRKGGRALCTLYPDDGFFTCLVTIGNREVNDAEGLLPLLSDTVQELYRSAKPINGARWLMIPITTAQLLEDAKQLVELRIKKQS